jgi:hypothetical protein
MHLQHTSTITTIPFETDEAEVAPAALHWLMDTAKVMDDADANTYTQTPPSSCMENVKRRLKQRPQ